MSNAERVQRVAVLGLIAVSALVLSASCSTNATIRPHRAPELLELAGASRPVRLRLLIAPIVDARSEPGSEARLETEPATAEPDGAEAAPAEGEDPAVPSAAVPVPRVDLAALRDEIVKALNTAQVFGEVAPTGFRSSVGRADAPLGAEEADEASVNRALLEDAYAGEQPFDLLLTLKLTRYDVDYLGHETHPGRYALSVIWFLQTYFFPTWWIADEDFRCSFALEATLVAVGSERRLIDRKVYEGEGQLVLDDWERGISLLGPFRVRQSLDEDDWRSVADLVGGPARAQAESALARDLKAIADPEKARALDALAYPAGLRTRYALCIGASDLDPRRVRRVLLQAQDDARGLHDLLVEGGVVPAKNAQLLVRTEATRAEIVRRLKDLVRRARAGDLLYVVFAGFGAGPGGEPVLVPADFDPARPRKTGLSLRQLAAILDRSPCDQVVLVDASFAPKEKAHARSLATPREAPAPPAPELIDRLRRRNRVWVLAAGLTEQAHSTEQRYSNFTGFLLNEAQRDKAPANAEGQVTLNGVFSRVRRATQATYDPPQEPLWIGFHETHRDPEALQIPLLRRAATGETASAD